MKEKYVKLISEYCDNVFFRCQNEDCDKLLVFLPSVNGKDIYPYYPRMSWGEELSKTYNVLYISDPFQPLLQYKVPMGSWFISPDGDFTLDILAKKIDRLIIQLEVKDVLFYGSSMGGYAAIILSSLVQGSKAVAECPQLYLEKHPGSGYVCENILKKNISVNEIEPLYFLIGGRSKSIKIVCSVFDHHYSRHVLPFLQDIKDSDQNERVNISLCAYISHEYKKGHVALLKKDALSTIESMFKL